MTIAEMRTLTGLPEDATDAEVVAAYAALIDDGLPSSIVLVEPVTVDQLRSQRQMDDELDDDFLAQKLRAAREVVEEISGRIIAQQTLVAHFRAWGSYLEIFKRPVVSVDAISYTGLTEDATYVDARYSLGSPSLRIFPGASGWPRLRTGGGVTVVYTAGYDAGEVPHKFVEAILVVAAGMLSSREGGYAQSLAAARALCGRKPGIV